MVDIVVWYSCEVEKATVPVRAVNGRCDDI